MAVELLQHENLEHQQRIEGRATALAIITGYVAQYILEIASKALPIDDLHKPAKPLLRCLALAFFRYSMNAKRSPPSS